MDVRDANILVHSRMAAQYNEREPHFRPENTGDGTGASRRHCAMSSAAGCSMSDAAPASSSTSLPTCSTTSEAST